MRMRRAAFILCIALISSSLEAGTFVLPDGDLPEATVGECRVAFMRNGSLAAAVDGHWIFDLGLSYATPGWKEWGTQIRRSEPRDTWALKNHGQLLKFDGILHSLERKKWFLIQQETTLLPHGLRFFYHVSPLLQQELDGFGATLHMPIAETSNAYVEFWPGFKTVPLPAEHDKGLLEAQRARAAVLVVDGTPRFSLITKEMAEWTVYDDREWNNNTYRIIVRDRAATATLGAGNDAMFSYDLALSNGGQTNFPMQGFSCNADAYGRVALSVGGQKVMEGGLASDAIATEWLHQRCRAETPSLSIGEFLTPIALCAVPDAKNPLLYSLKAGEQDDALLLEYAIENINTAKMQAMPVVTFAIPKSAVEDAPVISKPSSAESENGETRDPLTLLPYTVTLKFNECGPIVLSASRFLRIEEREVGGVECYILLIDAPALQEKGAGKTRLLIHTGEEGQ